MRICRSDEQLAVFRVYPDVILLTLSALLVLSCNLLFFFAFEGGGSEIDSWGGCDVRYVTRTEIDIDRLACVAILMEIEIVVN